MVWKAAAGVIVAGSLLAGCAQPKPTPAVSAPVQPMDETAVSNLEQSWRQSHPGSLIGHVNGVLPERHILSVTGLPLDQIHEGDIVTILPNGQTNNVITAKVFGKDNGFAQLEYRGTTEPRQGDLAMWYAAAANDDTSTTGSSTALPTTQPGATAPETPTPAPTTPTPAPTTPTPAPSPAPTAPPETTPPPPTTPAPTTPAPTTPPGSSTPAPPPTPPADNKLPSDLNK